MIIQDVTVGMCSALLIQSLVLTMGNHWAELVTMDRKALWQFTLAGFCSGRAVLLLFYALGNAEIVIVTALFNMRIWLLMLMSRWILGKEEKITARVIGAGGIIFAGATIILAT